MLSITRQRLIIVRGLQREGKTVLARALAERLAGGAVALHFSDLCDRWIVNHRTHRASEIELCYRLLKLLVISFLKEAYSVVVDAPFVDADGRERADELDEITRLARTFRGVRPVVVTLLASVDQDTVPHDAERHAAREDEIVVEGEGGDVEAIAAELAGRIEAL